MFGADLSIPSVKYDYPITSICRLNIGFYILETDSSWSIHDHHG